MRTSWENHRFCETLQITDSWAKASGSSAEAHAKGLERTLACSIICHERAQLRKTAWATDLCRILALRFLELSLDRPTLPCHPKELLFHRASKRQPKGWMESRSLRRARGIITWHNPKLHRSNLLKVVIAYQSSICLKSRYGGQVTLFALRQLCWELLDTQWNVSRLSEPSLLLNLSGFLAWGCDRPWKERMIQKKISHSAISAQRSN